MKKFAIVTRADDNIKEMCDVSHPILKMFAEKWNADFIILNEDKGRHSHWRILQLYNILEDYDRIACIDTDTLIMPKCPNLFEGFPTDCILSVFEDKGTREKIRQSRIEKYLSKVEYDGIEYKNETFGYINTGVFVVGKEHRELFNPTEKEIEIAGTDEMGFDDVLFSCRAHYLNFPFYELSYKFNHMTMFSEPWNGSPSRFDSWIIHYAGAGLFQPCKNRLEMMRQDKLCVYKEFG